MIFLLVVLKIPVAYLGYVIWWAIKAEPRPDVPPAPVAVADLDPNPGWQRRSHGRRPGGPVRRPGPRRAVAPAGARR
jgi:hypothetical protein